MGKITQYQVQKLASSAVGVPQQDNSGQIIAEGVQKVVNTGTQLLVERKDKLTNLEVAPALEDLRYKQQQLEAKMQQDYGANGANANDYQKYPEAIRAESKKLSDSIAKTLSPDAATKFTIAADSYIGGQADQWFSFPKKREIENAQRDTILGFSKRATSLSDIQDPDKFFTARTQAFDEQMKLSAGIIEPQSSIALADKYGKAALDSHLDKRLMNDPLSLERDLASGKYPANEVDRTAWEGRIALRKKAMAQEALIVNSGKMLDLADNFYQQYLNGTLSLQGLKLAKEDLQQKIRSGKVSPDWDNVVKIANAAEQRIIAGPKAVTPQSEAKTDEIVREWANHVEKNAENGVDEYMKVLKMYTGVWEEYGKGNIDDTKFRQVEQIMRTTTTRKMPGGKPQVTTVTPDKALQKAASGQTRWFFQKKTAEEYGVLALKDYLKEQFKGKSQAEQGSIMLPYLAKMFDTIQNTDPITAQKLIDQNDKVRENTIRSMLFGSGVGTQHKAGVVDAIDQWVNQDTGEVIEPGKPFVNKYGVTVVPVLKSPTGEVYYLDAKKVKFQ